MYLGVHISVIDSWDNDVLHSMGTSIRLQLENLAVWNSPIPAGPFAVRQAGLSPRSRTRHTVLQLSKRPVSTEIPEPPVSPGPALHETRAIPLLDPGRWLVHCEEYTKVVDALRKPVLHPRRAKLTDAKAGRQPLYCLSKDRGGFQHSRGVSHSSLCRQDESPALRVDLC